MSLDGPPRWTPLATSGPAPAARRSPAGAVRVHDGRAELVVAMGYTASTGQHHGDVWSLDLGADDAAWVQLDSGGGPGDPWARRSAAGVYDPVADRFLLAFGRDADGVHRRAVVVRPDDPHLVATAWVTVPALAKMGGWTSPS